LIESECFSKTLSSKEHSSKSPCFGIYGMNAELCVVFAGMVLNIMKGLCGGHFPSEGNITDTLVQQFSSKSVTHGNHHK
jgi:hypothetical protein